MHIRKLNEPKELFDVAPGTRALFEIPMARRSSGGEISIKVHVARGTADGPTLGLVAAIHGDASYGSHIVRTAMQRFDLTKIRGTIIAIPVANPIAFESNTRTTGQGWNTDMNNMNRTFPGDPKGWFTKRMAWAVYENLVKQSDAILDYHAGRETTFDYTLVNGDATAEEKRIFDFTRLMDTGFIYVHDQDPFVGTIDQATKDLGKYCIVAEQGGNIVKPDFHERSQTRIDNYMKAMGMIDGEPQLRDSQLVMRGGRTDKKIDHGGLFYPAVGIEALDTIVKGGTLLGTVLDAHTFEVLEEIRAPYAQTAMFQVRTQFSLVNPGDYAYLMGDAGRGSVIPKMTNWKLDL